jgi:hypothetical protein
MMPVAMLGLSRLATISFTRLFSCDGILKVHGLDSTDHRGLKARAPSSLPFCPEGEHVLYRDGSFKGIAVPKARSEMLSCKLLSTAAAVQKRLSSNKKMLL